MKQYHWKQIHEVLHVKIKAELLEEKGIQENSFENLIKK